MNFNSFVTAALLLTSVSADFAGNVNAASSAASVLKGRVDRWSSRNGLLAAWNIQNYFPTLARAVNSLHNDARNVQDSQIDVNDINAFGAAVTDVLSSLTHKARDFQVVGASGLVRGDLEQLSSPAVGIVDGIIRALANDCDKVKQLTDALNAIDSGFASANSAFGASQVSFEKPQC